MTALLQDLSCRIAMDATATATATRSSPRASLQLSKRDVHGSHGKGERAPSGQAGGFRSVESFALVDGPMGVGLVVNDLSVGLPMGAWLEPDALVVAGQSGVVRIRLGREVRQRCWPDAPERGSRASGSDDKRPMGPSGGPSRAGDAAQAAQVAQAAPRTIDLMEITTRHVDPATAVTGKDTSQSLHSLDEPASTGQRTLWRLPLLQPVHTLVFGSGLTQG